LTSGFPAFSAMAAMATASPNPEIRSWKPQPERSGDGRTLHPQIEANYTDFTDYE